MIVKNNGKKLMKVYNKFWDIYEVNEPKVKFQLKKLYFLNTKLNNSKFQD